MSALKCSPNRERGAQEPGYDATNSSEAITITEEDSYPGSPHMR